MSIFSILGALVRAFLRDRVDPAAEITALRRQLAILQRSANRPKLRRRDPVFWVRLSRVWASWRSVLLIVKPEAVIRWHRQGFKLYWRWKPRQGKPGRPKAEREIRDLIRRTSTENPTWGAPVAAGFSDIARRQKEQALPPSRSCFAPGRASASGPPD